MERNPFWPNAERRCGDKRPRRLADSRPLPRPRRHHGLPADPAELRALDVQPLDRVAGGHHAPPVRAVAQAEGVAQFVGGFFHQAGAEQVLASGQANGTFTAPFPGAQERFSIGLPASLP